MAEDVLTALKEAKDDRDCETKLVLLLTFDRFDLIRKFRKSRLEILYGASTHSLKTLFTPVSILLSFAFAVSLVLSLANTRAFASLLEKKTIFCTILSCIASRI